MQICPCGKSMFPNVAPPARSCFLATSPKDSARASSAQKPVSRQSYGLNAARLCVKSHDLSERTLRRRRCLRTGFERVHARPGCIQESPRRLAA